jgi:hypothetical protein
VLHPEGNAATEQMRRRVDWRADGLVILDRGIIRFMGIDVDGERAWGVVHPDGRVRLSSGAQPRPSPTVKCALPPLHPAPPARSARILEHLRAHGAGAELEALLRPG